MKILCVLYDDPKGGMPKSYPLGDLPKLDKYPDGMTLPSPNLFLNHLFKAALAEFELVFLSLV